MIAKGEIPSFDKALREIRRHAAGAARLTRRLGAILSIADAALEQRPLDENFREPKKRDIAWKRSPMVPDEPGWYLCWVIKGGGFQHEVLYYDGAWGVEGTVHGWLTVKIPKPK